jgi:hypothetical protein
VNNLNRPWQDAVEENLKLQDENLEISLGLPEAATTARFIESY